MRSETVKPAPSSEGERNSRQVYREVKEMVSTLTKNLSNLHKPGSSHELGDENEQGFGIITLAGTNTGAVMRGNLLRDHENKNQQQNAPNLEDDDEFEGSDTYVNSNYQAVNNSIMFGSTYTSNDPGVHLDISEFGDPYKHTLDRHGLTGGRKGKKVTEGSENPYLDYAE